jgi:phosphate-selective porin OprO/OprP
LLLGVDTEFLFQTGTSSGAASNTNNLTTLNDRIEVRIDPATNALLNTGTLANVSGVKVYSGEAAAQVGSFYAQGEYFDYRINRFSGVPDLHFNGGYAQASFTLTGEQHKYDPVVPPIALSSRTTPSNGQPAAGEPGRSLHVTARSV